LDAKYFIEQNKYVRFYVKFYINDLNSDLIDLQSINAFNIDFTDTTDSSYILLADGRLSDYTTDYTD